MSDLPSMGESSVAEEVCVVSKCDVGSVRAFSLKDAKFDDWWWIDWTSIGRGCEVVSTINLGINTRDSLHFAPDPQALARSGC